MPDWCKWLNMWKKISCVFAFPANSCTSSITRTSIKNPELGVFLQNESFTLQEALECYTTTNYWLTNDEDKNYDDYIIIDKDINKCTIDEIKDISVLETYIDGKLVKKQYEELSIIQDVNKLNNICEANNKNTNILELEKQDILDVSKKIEKTVTKKQSLAKKTKAKN